MRNVLDLGHAGASSSGPKPKEAKRIFVFEDDPDTRELLFEALSDEGYTVRLASDGKVGLESLREDLPDLVLLDVMMPGMDGLEVCNRIRSDERLKSLPVLIVTAKDEFTDKMRGFQAGGDDYVTKPFILGELLARIRVHLRLQELKKDLALSEKRYRLLIENSPDGILSISPGRELLFHNSRFMEILHGRTKEPLTGRILQALFPVSDLFREISLIVDQLVATNKRVFRESFINTSNQGNLHLEIIGIPVVTHPAVVEIFLVVVRDISQRRRMEEALIQAEKINSLGILTAGIAHEVNNPLTCISNAVQILKKSNLAPTRKSELCDLILDNIDRIVKIVRDLHIFSRPSGAPAQPFVVAEATNETISLIRYQIKDGSITCQLIDHSEPLYVFGDRNHFQQVMINLLVNAIHAITGQGTITIRLSRKEDDALITVEDTGCGIPTDQLGQIFNPFFTTKREWKGTGLGLAVSYRIIQLFKGTISVHTAVGKGTRFTISIPLYQVKKHQPA